MPRLSRKRNLRGKKKKSFRKNYSKSKRRLVKKRISKRKRKMRGGADFSHLAQTRCNLKTDGPVKIACLTQVIKSKLEELKTCQKPEQCINDFKLKLGPLMKGITKAQKETIINNISNTNYQIGSRTYFFEDKFFYGGFETENTNPPEETFEGFRGG